MKKQTGQVIQRFSALFFGAVIALVLTGCSNPTDSTPHVKSLASLDLAGAKAIYIGVHQSAEDASGQTRDVAVNLFKITTGNTLEKVQYLSNEETKLFTEMEPVALYDSEGGYFILGLGNITSGSFEVRDGYLVRKADGTVAQLGYGSQFVFPGRQTYFANSGTLQMDGADNIYFIDYFSGEDLFKLSLSGETYDLEQINTLHRPLQWCMVDGAGNLALANNSDVNYLSLLLTAGKKTVDLESLNFWVAADNHLYVDQYNSDDQKHDIIKIVPTDNDTVTFDTVATDLDRGVSLSHGMNFLLNADQRTVIAQQQQDSSAILWDVSPDDGAPRIIATPDIEFSQVNAAAATSDAFYFAGKTAAGDAVLVRLDALSDAISIVSEDYTVTLLEASDLGEVFFSGSRVDDEANVVGLISTGGAISVLDDSMASPVIAMLNL